MAEQRDNPQQDSLVFGQFVGLRNTITHERLSPQELVDAENVDIDDAGQIRRRRGFTKVSDGDFHSLHNSPRGVLVVKDGVLGWLDTDYTHRALKAGVGSERLAYTTVADTTYFSSSTVSGKILADDTVADWGHVTSEGVWFSPVTNPTSTLAPIAGELRGAPPMATELAAYSGRIYLANDKVLWATELYLYDYIDKTRNFIQFESPITALADVSDGLFVGTETATYFLKGVFGKMRMEQVLDYGALRGSMVHVTSHLVRPEGNMSAMAVMFMTNSGLCVGLDHGITYNITEQRVLLPNAQSVAAMYRKQDGINQYVGVLDHGGTPASKARIGDYVDAEIRRFQGG